MTAIDSFTVLPPRVYEAFLRAGDRARRRGQHCKALGPDGSTTLRLSDPRRVEDEPPFVPRPPATPLMNHCRQESAVVTASSVFRTVAVVPRSHSNGMFERLQGFAGAPCNIAEVTAQALPLDLRPSIKGISSALVVWDSRLLSGHVRVVKPQRQRLLRPLDEAAPGRTLAKEGYAAMGDVLPKDDADEALRLLLSDIRVIDPSVISLSDVRKQQLPPERRGRGDLRNGVLRDGQFARFLATRPAVARAFQRLLGLSAGAPLASVVSAVALAPPVDGGPVRAGRPALRLGFSAPQASCWKAYLQLFPGDTSAGGTWERIAVMFCVAPSKELLALSLSRALLGCSGTCARSKQSGVNVLDHNRMDEQFALLTPSVGSSGVASSCIACSNTEDAVNDVQDRAEKHGTHPVHCLSATDVLEPRPSEALKRPHPCSLDSGAGGVEVIYGLDFGVAGSSAPAKRMKTSYEFA